MVYTHGKLFVTMSETFNDKFNRVFAAGLQEQREREERIKQAKLEAELERRRKKEARQNVLWQKYFVSESKSNLQNALLKSAEKGGRVLYFNFDREDFEGWHNLVEGGYKNAHPSTILHSLLSSAKQSGSLPSCVTWDIWNNGAFTTVFTW